MCGIVGFCAKDNVMSYLIDGLERLEYRGYDSAGVAVLNQKIQVVKTKGRISSLKKLLEGGLNGKLGIGHTRWATHGAPSDINAHPHLSRSGKFAVVHNGIIENYAELKQFLLDRSFPFYSETDTEVIGHLIEYYYQGDPVDAIIKAAQRIQGSYALAILCSDSPDTLYAMRKESPLVIGKNEKGSFAASDMSALITHTKEFIFPECGEIAILKPDYIKIINFNKEEIEKKITKVNWEKDAAQKGGFEYFMLKEIYEQPRAIKDTLSELNQKIIHLKTLSNVKRLHIIGCGSAYHAAVAAKYFIENLCKIPTECDTASEYRYKNPIIENGTLAIAISQSGETADTIAAIKRAQQNTKVLSIVNVLGSTIARISDEVIYTLAGPEIAVATTKGYTSQIAALYTIGLFLIRQRLLDGLPTGLNEIIPFDDALEKTKIHNADDNLSDNLKEKNIHIPKRVEEKLSSGNIVDLTGKGETISLKQILYNIEQKEKLLQKLNTQPYEAFELLNSRLKKQLMYLSQLEDELNQLPLQIETLLKNKEIFQQLSARFSFVPYAFYIGRGIDYAIAMEGALKLKEISYIHAQSYPAGELKHGTISLIEEGSLVIAISTDQNLCEKIISNIREVQSRGAVVLSITCFEEVAAVSDYYAKVPSGLNAPILASVTLQLFAYYTALARGCDIDKPRNLAKSVTVE